MEDILGIIVFAIMGLFFLFLFVGNLIDTKNSALDYALKSRQLKKEQESKELEEAKKQIAALETQNRELESIIKCLNQAEWKKQYFDLQTLYYKMYLEYNQDPTAKSAEDLFPIEEKRLSAAQLHYALADEKARTQRLEESLSAHKQEIFEYKNEIQALEFEMDELIGELNESEDYKKQYDDLKKSLPLSHLICTPCADAYSKAMDSAKGEKATSGNIIVKKIELKANPVNSSPPYFIRAEVYSGTSDTTYHTSLTNCNCKNYEINSYKGIPYACKHMIALALTMNVLPITKK